MDILKECENAKRIGISGHIRPDGDCVGSCLAMWQYLTNNLPNAKVTVFLEKPADIFNEIKGYDEIDSTFLGTAGVKIDEIGAYEKNLGLNSEEDKADPAKGEDGDAQNRFDVFFALDCGAERLGEAEKFFYMADKKINIDHHISNQGTDDINLVRPEVGSVCEVVYELMDKKLIDKDIAMALYIGIIHDTGVFQYSNTRPETLQIASHLITFGFDFPRLIEETFYQKTYVQSQIMGRTLMESIRFMDGQCIVGVIEKKTMDFYGVNTKDLDGIVNQLRNIKGVHCAIFMYESGVLEYKVSMRSDDKVDVSQVASFFGGGGHKRAAGCTMKGTLHDCVNNLSLHIAKQLA